MLDRRAVPAGPPRPGELVGVSDAIEILRRLASSNPDAPVIQTTYARALKEAGQLKA